MRGFGREEPSSRVPAAGRHRPRPPVTGWARAAAREAGLLSPGGASCWGFARGY